MAKSIISKSKISLFILFILLIPFLFFLSFNKRTSQSYQRETDRGEKEYQARSLNFSITMPNQFTIKDEELKIILQSNDGQIEIIRNGTNYSNIDDYISEFDRRRNIVASGMQDTLINGYKAKFRIVNLPAQKIDQKSYYIYANNFIYIFSTSSNTLYNDLDTIAQSFKYIP